jgi:hypothetical protein
VNSVFALNILQFVWEAQHFVKDLGKKDFIKIKI